MVNFKPIPPLTAGKESQQTSIISMSSFGDSSVDEGSTTMQQAEHDSNCLLDQFNQHQINISAPTRQEVTIGKETAKTNDLLPTTYGELRDVDEQQNQKDDDAFTSVSKEPMDLLK